MTLSVRTAPLAIGLAFGVAGLSALVSGQAQQPPNPCASAPAQASVAAPAQPAGRGTPPPAKPETPAPAAPQILEGTDQDDRLTGGTGDDWLLGKNGADVLNGCEGKDKIDGGEGEDRIDGGPDSDIVDSGAGRDFVAGNDGNDTLDGSDNEDQLDGGGGDDDLDGGDDNDALRGGPGNDVLAGGDGDDQLSGDAGNDRVSGADGSDMLTGGPGDDVILGGEGADSLSGDAGDDRLDGADGIDLLRGGAGNDTLLGSSDADALHGQEGHDQLLGGDGADMLDGAQGMDWLLGGAGADTMLGGAGDDIFVIRAGDVPAGEVEVIGGGDGTDIVFLSGFARATKAAGELRLVDPATGGVYILVNIERIEYTTILGLSEQAAGQAISLLLVNPSTTASEGRVMFFGATGAVVPATAAGQAPREILTFSVPALGSVRLNATLAQPGIAQVFANSPIAATLQGGASGSAVPHGPTPLVDTAVVPVLERQGIGTGVLVANSATASSVRLTLRKMDGGEMDEQVVSPHQFSVPAYGHRVFYIRDLFPSLKDFQGTLTVEGGYVGDWPQEGGSIAVVMLDRGATGRVTGVPSLPLAPAAPSGPVHLARVVPGHAATSSIVLVNPSAAGRAVGTLRLYDEAGAPWAVLGERPNTSASAPFDIGPAGSAVFAVSPAAPGQQGSARADVTRGRVASLLRVSSAGQVTHLASNELLEGFIAPVKRDRSNGVSASFAMSAAGAAVTLRCKLRTAAGADVPGGEAELRLPANGQTIRTLEQLFPTAATDTFDGTVTVRAEGGSVAASVVQIGPGATAPIVLPVIRLQ